ncbi:MAG: FIST C-terminal domain-containing protein, partial [Lachnospiraceae bacterium]|nr:FIST C-terminal domain-containing protein [Lachnospiraceae bacterium]
MLQKTYQIYDFDHGKLEKVLQEVQEMPAYKSAKQVLLVVYEQNWDKLKIKKKTEKVREFLPKTEIAGINHRNEWNFLELQRECSIFSFLFFEEKTFTIFHYDLKRFSDRELGRALNEDVKSQKSAKGAMIFLAELFRNLDEMLAEAEKGIEELPVFGAPSAFSSFFETDGVGYVFDEEDCYEEHMIAVVFSGEEIYLKVSCIYGWTPIGKQMTITKMDGVFHVLEIDHRPAAEIYRKYMGLEDTNAIMANICEFPITIDKPEGVAARIPAGCYPDGSMMFAAPLHEGDHIRFSYGVVDNIQTEAFYDSYRYRDFVPEGMFLIVCMNRVIFLKELEKIELNYYREFGPELSYLHGNSEIYRHHGTGWELNSVLVAVGLREGKPGAVHPSKYETCEVGAGITPELAGIKKEDSPAAEKESAKEETEEERLRKLSADIQKLHIPIEFRLMNFMRAVTEDLEELAEEARSASRAKSSFLSNMSHEIRTPINAVLGLNEMILRESGEKQIRGYAMDIQSAGNTLLTLINDILDVSRIESGKMEIVSERYDLSSMIHDLAQMTRLRAEKKELEFFVHVSEELPSELYGDEVRVKQVLTNILTNAVKYTPTGSVTLRIDGRREGDVEILRCEVEDTGIGIKEEDLPKLFDAFQRIEEKRNRQIEGNGLGMNITQELLFMMGSRLQVESVYGSGSKFWFELEQKIISDTPIGRFEDRIKQSSEE